MNEIHTTPQILEAANFALLRAIIITLENKGLISAGDAIGIGNMAVDMCKRGAIADPKSNLGAAQLIEHWVTDTFR